MARTKRRRRGRVLLPVGLLVAVLAGYVGADIADVAPGPLTTRPEVAPTSPFPPVPAPVLGEIASLAPAAAAIPSADALARVTGDLLAVPEVGPDAGVLVVDVATGEEVTSAGAPGPHTPASTTKVLTAAAAIATAGPEHRFVTRVVDDLDAIILVGGGDLALAAGPGDPDAVLGHAGLADLAERTAQALLENGRTEVEVLLDESYYAGPPLAPRWDETDLAAGDAMVMSPLAVDVGRVDGQRARSPRPGADAAAAFAAALGDHGITVAADIGQARAADDAPELAAVESAPLGDLVAVMLQRSENILSEGIGRLVAHELGREPSFVGAGEAIGEALAARDIDVDGLVLHDSAGLSGTNAIDPATLVQTLLTVATEPDLGAVARGLPVAGLEGTLSDRLTQAPAAGLVHAKTGTLFTVVSLAGYVTTADGRLLAFAVMADDVPRGSAAAARIAIDDWTARIAGCGC